MTKKLLRLFDDNAELFLLSVSTICAFAFLFAVMDAMYRQVGIFAP